MQPASTQSSLTDALNVFDADRDGKVGVEELRQVLLPLTSDAQPEQEKKEARTKKKGKKKSSQPFKEEDIDSLLKSVKDANDLVDVNDFASLLSSK